MFDWFFELLGLSSQPDPYNVIEDNRRFQANPSVFRNSDEAKRWNDAQSEPTEPGDQNGDKP